MLVFMCLLHRIIGLSIIVINMTLPPRRSINLLNMTPPPGINHRFIDVSTMLPPPKINCRSINVITMLPPLGINRRSTDVLNMTPPPGINRRSIDVLNRKIKLRLSFSIRAWFDFYEAGHNQKCLSLQVFYLRSDLV